MSVDTHRHTLISGIAFIEDTYSIFCFFLPPLKFCPEGLASESKCWRSEVKGRRQEELGSPHADVTAVTAAE